MAERLYQHAQTIWDYHVLNQNLKSAYCIVVLGSNDVRVAERAAELFHLGLSPKILFSGRVGELTPNMFDCSEAEAFASIAMTLGVPQDAILIESLSTNTGENILFSQQLFDQERINPQSILLVQKPFMERRALATAQVYWADKDLQVTSPQFSFDNYPNEILSFPYIVNVMLGDLQRIDEYPALGYSVKQDIPSEVWHAYKELVALGFTGHLLKK
ncbi:hypothetical protein PDPUS_2_00980 [Photobacterium damselae subsp. piscicida]|uniref:YdcF family protein n=1 Tax=Photobacterium damsela subsp. piscicida TaxID=38294 RepID=A0A1V1VDD5_PHODP|nr:YdcF family protein [Photobacterium damselae]MBE8127327.1 YdcF family protein [Photobacterium damselae subsp. piscicida]PSV62722.1 YdcF family protein [Photobacterium damselae]PSW76343.1 YdcF family protein [Photobacterium damselae]QOD54814.1 YdcF family protein [Photobacterium damselae subsp. piscicida]QOD58166.1 YdcF family protein [Photobacterium damselae subsp. piscicida]